MVWEWALALEIDNRENCDEDGTAMKQLKKKKMETQIVTMLILNTDINDSTGPG